MAGQSKEYLAKIGKRFGDGIDPSEAGKKGGKAKSILTYLQDDLKIETGYKFSKSSIIELMENLISMDVATLKRLKDNDSIPIPLASYISGLLEDKEKGRTVTLDNMLDRLYGKALERVESKVETKDTTFEDLEEEIKDLIRKNGLSDSIKG